MSWWQETQLFKHVVDELEDYGFVLLDAAGCVLTCNAAAVQLKRLRREELIGRHVTEIYGDEARGEVIAQLAQATKTGQAAYQGYLVRRDGSRFWGLVTTIRVNDATGGHLGYARITCDLSASKAHEEALAAGHEELERRVDARAAELQDIYDHAPCGYHSLDAQGRFVAVNATELAWLGYCDAEMLGKPFVEFLSKESQRLFAAEFPGFKERGFVRDLEFNMLCKDGTYLPVLLNATAVCDERGHYLQSRSTIVDMTALKAAQAERQSLSNFLHSVVENIPTMIFIKDAQDLRFEFINRAAEELLGTNRADLIGKNDYDLFPNEQAAAFQEMDRKTLQDGKLVNIPEECIQTAHGERWLYTKKIPILADGGRPTHLLGISVDITDERAARQALLSAKDHLEQRVEEGDAALQASHQALQQSEQQLIEAQKMEAVGRLAGGVAHDFNNMLAVILSYAVMLAEDLAHDGDRLEDAKAIIAAAERAAAITQQLLAFSRRQVLQPKAIYVNEVVSDLERILLRLLGDDVVLNCVLNPTVGAVHADRGQLEQVLVNLAVNARDAMPSGGKLTIETAHVRLDEHYAAGHLGVRPGPYIMLALSDTGQGMTREVRQRIFEPFYTTKKAGKGTGLGLSTVFGIIKQSGGDIWVYSELGKGTTFKVYLPELQNVLPVMAEEQPLPVNLQGTETILLVEDEELVRRAARASLARLGYLVLEAAGAEEALLLCDRFGGTIHLMVTDVVMPFMTGRELAERLYQTRPRMKVLYMSGYTENTIVHHGVLDEGIWFVQKPFTPESLASQVRALLDKSKVDLELPTQRRSTT